jgi:hypothetical protein
MGLWRGPGAAFFCFAFLLIRGPLKAQDSSALLKKALAEQGVGFCEAPAFTGNGTAGEETGKDGSLSLLVPDLRGKAGRETQSPATQRGEEPPVCIIAVPVENAGEGLSFGIQTGLSLVNLLKNQVNDTPDRLPRTGENKWSARLLIVFMGPKDTMYLRNFSGTESAAVDAWALDEYPGSALLLFFDPGEAPQSLALHYRSSQIRTPLFMLKSLAGLCESQGIPFSLVNNAAEKSAAILDYAGVLELGALYLGGVSAAGESAQGLSPETLAALLLDFLASLDEPLIDADYHYSVIPLPGRAFWISEPAKAALALIIAGVFLAMIILLYRIYTNRAAINTHAALPPRQTDPPPR